MRFFSFLNQRNSFTRSRNHLADGKPVPSRMCWNGPRETGSIRRPWWIRQMSSNSDLPAPWRNLRNQSIELCCSACHKGFLQENRNLVDVPSHRVTCGEAFRSAFDPDDGRNLKLFRTLGFHLTIVRRSRAASCWSSVYQLVSNRLAFFAKLQCQIATSGLILHRYSLIHFNSYWIPMIASCPH